MEAYRHVPVLLEEVLHYLQPRPNRDFIDCTLGGGGHAVALLERIGPNGRLLAIDLDPTALASAGERIATAIPNATKRFIPIEGNFKQIKKIAYANDFRHVDGILLDLGLSSGQLSDHLRGFSFLAEGTLDMRFGRQGGPTAADILNRSSESELTEIFKTYGEEPLAKVIARQVVRTRKAQPITKPAVLVSLLAEIYRQRYRSQSRRNPATKVFQALRIAVNHELENLEQALPAAIDLLAAGGRVAVISYHSLEDRIVKLQLRGSSQRSRDGENLEPKVKLVTRKPVVPAVAEQTANPRSRSAKLRVAEKI